MSSGYLKRAFLIQAKRNNAAIIGVASAEEMFGNSGTAEVVPCASCE
jgi:hypothetical protein